MDLSRAKAALRACAKARRAELHARIAVTASDAVPGVVARTPELGNALRAGVPAAAYWPIGSELDPGPLLRHWAAVGLVCALPVVVRAGMPLVFRRWRPEMELVAGDFGTSVPPEGGEAVVPDVIFAPLLAADRTGGRLGYGAGFYDRTLAALRSAGSVLAVGLAYHGQIVDHVPSEPDDEPLDWLVTERAAIPIDAAARRANP